MRVHLVDGTYELFRHYYALPSRQNGLGLEIAAARGVAHSLLGLVEQGATHVAVATDHVIESFRNTLWPGYKTSAGIDPALYAQFVPLETALAALGFVVWPMIEQEADDALAAGAALAAADERVEEVLICSPDKDLSQCVRGRRVVMLDRRRDRIVDEAFVRERYGVPPAAIPDWLALVGDRADGYPGIPGFGEKSAAVLLERYGRIEQIPDLARDWAVRPRGAERLAGALAERREEALLFRVLATLRTDAEVGSIDAWRYQGPRPGADLEALGVLLDDAEIAARAKAASR